MNELNKIDAAGIDLHLFCKSNHLLSWYKLTIYTITKTNRFSA